MNFGTFSGRLGRDAELNKMQSGDPVLNFSMAVDIGTKDNPKTMWVECALFGVRAEKLQRWLTRGVKVTVMGRITLDQYATRDGAQKTALRCTVTELDMHLPPKGDGQQTQQTQKPTPSPWAAPGGSGFDDMKDDIPF
jgi:single-strand DNA-binding protein